MSAAAATTAKRKQTEQELLHSDNEVRKLILDVVGKGIPGMRIEESITVGDVTRTIVGASTVVITVHDQARKIIRSGSLRDAEQELRAVDIHLDGLWFRLAKLSKQGDDLVFEFESRVVSRLRGKKGPRKLGSRKSPNRLKGLTRAEAILLLVRSIKAEKIPVRINELHKPQPIAKFTDQERQDKRDGKKLARDRNRAVGGFDAGASIANVNDDQKERIAVCLEEADKLKVSDRVKLAMLCAGFGESNFGENTGSRGTTFQTTQISEKNLDAQARAFMKGGGGFLAGGAIKAVKDHPYWTVGTVASKVEISDAAGPHYDKEFRRARKVLDAWKGGGATSGSGSYRKRYEFAVEKKETYWDAIQRMADEVHWRAFEVSGRFYYISEEDLFKNRARFRFGEESDGVYNIDFDQDYRKQVVTATATVRIHRWAIPPGCCVTLTGMGPASGKWLVESVTRSLFSSEATVTMKQPMRERLEPRSDLAQRGGGAATYDGNARGAKELVEQIFQIARKAGGPQVYVGSDYRPGSTTTSGNASDHSENNATRAARDIGVRGINLLFGPPSPHLDRAAVAIGEAFNRPYRLGQTIDADNFYVDGIRVQVIWRTPKYGGHMGHIHVGCHRERPSTKQKDQLPGDSNNNGVIDRGESSSGRGN